MKRTLILSSILLIQSPLWLAGCGGGEGISETSAQSPDAVLANAMEALKDDRPTVGGYRSALQQLDSYVSLQKDVATKLGLSEEERALISRQLLPRLLRRDLEARLKDLDRQSFTIVDAFHLDSCFLFRDAAQGLREYYIGEPKLPNDPKYDEYRLTLARLAFEWVMRQVHFAPPPPGLDPWPAMDILRRGTGDGEERARIFLALLEQLELDGCMVPRTIEVVHENRREPQELIWTPGVLIGSNVYLFESRLGKPIPSLDGRGIATLREVRQHPEILKQLYAGDPDPVTPAQLEKPAVLIVSSLPALSPRMRELQTWLLDAGNKAKVHQDLAATLKRFRDAKPDAEVRLWTTTHGYPTLALLRYLENPRSEPRLQETIVPRRALIPGWVHELAQQIGHERSRFLYENFDRVFLSIRVQPETIREEEVEAKNTSLLEGVPQPRRRTVRLGGVRDLLVRGRPELCVDRVLELEDRLGKMHDAFVTQLDMIPGQTEKALRTEWAPKFLAAVRRLDELQQQRQSSGGAPTAPTASDELLRNTDAAVQGLIKEQTLPLSFLSHEWALPELHEHLTYFMGLAKLELALRSEVAAATPRRGGAPTSFLTPAQQFASAADWFERYQALVMSRPRNTWGPAVANHLQTCRDAQKRLESK
jgi:hypothetical protein